MSNLFFEHPILNSPYDYPSRHWKLDAQEQPSDWETEFCRVAEAHPKVKAYMKNHNPGLEVPYRHGSETRTYLPDFIVLVDDGREAPPAPCRGNKIPLNCLPGMVPYISIK